MIKWAIRRQQGGTFEFSPQLLHFRLGALAISVVQRPTGPALLTLDAQIGIFQRASLHRIALERREKRSSET